MASRYSFTIHVSTNAEAKKILDLKTIRNTPCKVSIHPTFNFSRDLIYVENSTIDYIDEFLKEQYLQCCLYHVCNVHQNSIASTQAILIDYKRPIYGPIASIYPVRGKIQLCTNSVANLSGAINVSNIVTLQNIVAFLPLCSL